jgi:hypothetical protein
MTSLRFVAHPTLSHPQEPANRADDLRPPQTTAWTYHRHKENEKATKDERYRDGRESGR